MQKQSELAERSKALDRFSVFQSASKETVQQFAEKTRHVSYKAGNTIFLRDDPADVVLFVLSGRVRISVNSEDGRSLSFASEQSGKLFGELAALDGRPRSADAIAQSEVAALAMTAKDFQSLCFQLPDFNKAIIGFLCDRVRSVSDRLEDVALVPLESRLARFLLREVQGQAPNEPLYREDTRVLVQLDIPQYEIAFLLGASRPRVNQAFKALRQRRAIEGEGRNLVCYPARLSEF